MGARQHRLGTRVVALFLALAGLAYVAVYPYIGVVNNPNENVRTYMTMALVEDHTFRIDSIVERFGWVNDMARAPDKKTGESHLYSVKGPAVSYAGVPVYWALTRLLPRAHAEAMAPAATRPQREAWLRTTTFALRLVAVQIPCFLFLVWFERFLRRHSDDPILRLSAVAAVGLGTNYLAYALMFASHALFAVAAFASFAITTNERLDFRDARRRRSSRAFLAGLFAGLATLLEYHGLPLSAALGLYALTAFYRPTRLAALAAGAIPSALALFFFQWRAFGNPLMPGHRMSENQAFAVILNKGYFGIGMPDWHVAVELITSRTFGLVGTSPYMALGALALPIALLAGKRAPRPVAIVRQATAAWMLMMLLLLVTVSAAANWRGGWTIGPRYLGAAPPFLAFGAVLALEAASGASSARRALARALAGGLALASMAQTGLVSLVANSIPEGVSRPFALFALPLVRAGFVPHHAGELFGWSTPAGFYVVLGALVLAGLLVALWPHRESPRTYGVRVLVMGIVLGLGLRPALSKPAPSEGEGLTELHNFVNAWEPPGRDFIATTRTRAVRLGTAGACQWRHLARLERVVRLDSAATQDEARSASCP